jgi:hypothetical protein
LVLSEISFNEGDIEFKKNNSTYTFKSPGTINLDEACRQYSLLDFLGYNSLGYYTWREILGVNEEINELNMTLNFTRSFIYKDVNSASPAVIVIGT